MLALTTNSLKYVIYPNLQAAISSTLPALPLSYLLPFSFFPFSPPWHHLTRHQKKRPSGWEYNRGLDNIKSKIRTLRDGLTYKLHSVFSIAYFACFSAAFFFLSFSDAENGSGDQVKRTLCLDTTSVDNSVIGL